MSWSIYAADGTLLEHGDDATRTVTTGTSTRPYTADENAAADDAIAAAARMDDLEARVARIEAHLWPADTNPQPSTAPTWDDLGGIWPAGGLLLDGGVVYRNVSGVPLTTPPSGFPGSPDQWGHLFQRATSPEPEPEPGAPAWTEGVAYKVGDLATYAGTTYRCLQAHTAIVGWTPAAVPALWTPA